MKMEPGRGDDERQEPSSKRRKSISESQRLCEDFAQQNLQHTTPESVGSYKLLKTIGEGTYGVVYRAVDTRNNKAVAVKEMPIDPDNEGLPSVALREISLLGELRHRHIVNMLDVVVCENTLTVIFEYLDMDLRSFHLKQISRFRRLEFALARRFTYQLLEGLAYLHARQIIHRDMKPQNVLVDARLLYVKIGDFGLARIMTKPLRENTNEVVTLWYRPPELLLGADVYLASVDIWSVGVMLLEMLENDPPFDADSEIGALHMIFQTLGTPTSETWPDIGTFRHFCEVFPKWHSKTWREIAPSAPDLAVDLLRRIMVYPPEERITCREALKHPLFVEDRKQITAETEPAEANFLSPRHMYGKSDTSDGRDLAAAMSSL